MIVSASYRTDIPAFYAAWFLNRLRAGSAEVANPYGGRAYEVSLRAGEVDGFVFWTRNIGPLLADLGAVRDRAPFVVQFTVTGYPRALESSVIASEVAIAQIRALAGRWGPRAVVWRYDPVVLSSLTPSEWHVANFAALAGSLAGAVDEVAVSFVQPYRKTARNTDAAARRHGFAWRDPEDEEKRALLGRLASIAASEGIALTLCTQPHLIAPGVAEARCVDADRLGDVAGHPIEAREKGNRPGCRCAESRDIGAYDTCPHGCVYCYAVTSRDAVRRRYQAHDPGAAILFREQPRDAALEA
jgi:hypothetical protein